MDSAGRTKTHMYLMPVKWTLTKVKVVNFTVCILTTIEKEKKKRKWNRPFGPCHQRHSSKGYLSLDLGLCSGTQAADKGWLIGESG